MHTRQTSHPGPGDDFDISWLNWWCLIDLGMELCLCVCVFSYVVKSNGIICNYKPLWHRCTSLWEQIQITLERLTGDQRNARQARACTWNVCVWEKDTEKMEGSITWKNKTCYSISCPDPGEWRAGPVLRQRRKQINRSNFLGTRYDDSTHIHWRTQTCTDTLQTESKSICTWTSIQLSCLCNVSFTEPGPLTNCRPDPIFISGWKDGVEEHPASAKRKETTCHCNTSVKLNNNLTVWTSKQFSPNHCSFVFSLTCALELTGEWEGLYKRVWRRLKSILSWKKCKVNPWHFLLPNPNFFHHFKWCRCIKKLEKIS